MSSPDPLTEVYGIVPFREEGGELTFTEWFLKERNLRVLAMEQIKQRQKYISQRLANEIAALEARYLEDFTKVVQDDLKATPGTRKSVDYLHGRAGFRKKRDKIEILDEKAVVDFLGLTCSQEEFDACVEITYRVRRTELRKLVEAGAPVPGIRVIEGGEDEFYIRPADPVASPRLPE